MPELTVVNEILDWRDFFVASAGAAAALTGLLFVAVSINLARILEFPHLPIRAIETLVALLSVLVVATIGLIPMQSVVAYGYEIGGTAVISWVIQVGALIRSSGSERRNAKALLRIPANQLPPLAFFLAGVLLARGRPEGMFWVVPGILLSYVSGIFGAWVLLVKIQR